MTVPTGPRGVPLGTGWVRPQTRGGAEAGSVWGGWMELPELGRLLRDPGWSFVPDTRAVLRRLAEEGVGDYPALLGHPGDGRRSR